MLERARQFALWQGIAAESEIATQESLRKLDPLLRVLVRRRLRRIFRRVELESSTAIHDPAHRLRLAYLFGAGRRVANADDMIAVVRALDEVPPPASIGSRGVWVTGALVTFLALLGAGAMIARHALRPFSAKATPAGKILGEALSGYTVALGRGRAENVERTREALTGKAALEALGQPITTELSQLSRRMQYLVSASPAEAQASYDAYQNAVVALDKALESKGEPYFVDAEVHRTPEGTKPLVMSYYIQREWRGSGAGAPIRVVELWRLDPLRIALGAHGFTRASSCCAVILLDQAEGDLVTTILPGAAPTGRVELLDEETREDGAPWTVEVEERASHLVAESYRAVGGPLATDAIRIGTLLARRRDLLRKWQIALRGQGVRLSIPFRLFPETDYLTELEHRVPRENLQEWDDIQTELTDKLQSFEVLRDRFVKGVIRHEVQHRLDFRRGLMPVPKFLCEVLGLDNPLDAPYGSLAERSRDEASAYLAEAARNDDSPVLDLVQLSAHFFNRNMLGSAQAYAALEVYAAIGRELGIDVDSVLGRSISRERFSRLALSIWAKPPAEIRRAAQAAYLAEFGVPLEHPSFTTTKENPHYRPEN